MPSGDCGKKWEEEYGVQHTTFAHTGYTFVLPWDSKGHSLAQQEFYWQRELTSETGKELSM